MGIQGITVQMYPVHVLLPVPILQVILPAVVALLVVLPVEAALHAAINLYS